jgi:hypothetical protein
MCLIVKDCTDYEEHYVTLEAATRYLVEEVIPKCNELLLTRSYTLPLIEGLGLELSPTLHAWGINVRHLGLMRSRLWRLLPCTVNIYNYNAFIYTNRDMRREVAHGDKIRIDDVVYEVIDEGNTRITADAIPIKTKYLGESRNGLSSARTAKSTLAAQRSFSAIYSLTI